MSHHPCWSIVTQEIDLGMNVKQICQLILVLLKTKYNKCFLLLQLVDEEKVAGIGNAAGCYFLFVNCVIDVG